MPAIAPRAAPLIALFDQAAILRPGTASRRWGRLAAAFLLLRVHLENFPVPAFLRIQRMLGIGIRCGRPSPPLGCYDALAPSAKAWVLASYQS